MEIEDQAVGYAYHVLCHSYWGIVHVKARRDSGVIDESEYNVEDDAAQDTDPLNPCLQILFCSEGMEKRLGGSYPTLDFQTEVSFISTN